MTFGKRLERAIFKATSDLNRPTVDCIMIIGSFSVSDCNVGQAQSEASTAIVWTPCGWQTIARIGGETHQQFSNRILEMSSKPSIA